MKFFLSDKCASDDDEKMKESYRPMAEDIEREREAREWCEALIGDITEES